MTSDQKRALTGLAALFAFKAILYVSINRAAKYAREAVEQYETSIAGIQKQGSW